MEYAVNNRAGCIHLEDLSSHLDDLHNLKTCIFIGRDWPVYELLTMIENKAKEKGIKVEKVSPYKTSQTCSRCAVIKENFTFKDRAEKGMPQFECEACGFGKDSKISAHYNAARNIANSTLMIK